ncbi:hypothetical protein E2C01_073631 [Portunus trituberculatus]|uniref:Uncharacterized protein n=1 Tax=Portunus trituberculatus TaxID=210409 RepID=A0A5B7IE10_PORTR|nr:hypothetical protein [Portunus trituberculatus]
MLVGLMVPGEVRGGRLVVEASIMVVGRVVASGVEAASPLPVLILWCSSVGVFGGLDTTHSNTTPPGHHQPNPSPTSPASNLDISQNTLARQPRKSKSCVCCADYNSNLSLVTTPAMSRLSKLST